jgi:cytochrome d ubiquinol oxidase subunit II
MDSAWLTTFWAVLIIFSLFLYAVRDGYDLGVGILTGVTRERALREAMVRAISPFWDGNEVWLVLVGTLLFAAFPPVYAILLPAFYLPLTLMLLALVFRGVSFEFRHHAGFGGRFWDAGFFLGSLVVSFVQGAALGGLVQGIPVADLQYAGGSWEWLTPFAALCGAAAVLGHALLGASWLVLKTEGPLRDRSYRQLRWLLRGALAVFAGACLYASAVEPRIAQRWLQNPWLFLLPLLGLAACLGFGVGIRTRRDVLPYTMAAVMLLAAVLAVVGSFWPYLIPFSVTIEAAAAPAQALGFLFWGGGLLIFPLVLLYTVVVHLFLKGKW